MLKKLLFVAAINTLVFCNLVSCSLSSQIKGDSDSKVSKANIHRQFGATYMTMNNPFFVTIDNKIRSYIEERGDKLTTLDPELDIQKQISCIGELVSQGVDLIFLNPADYIDIKPALEIARKSNIPIIVVDAPVFDENLVSAIVVSDNYTAGVLCAKDVVKKRGGNTKTNIVVLEHPTAKSAVDRIAGFEKEISKYPEMNIIDRRASNGQLELAMSQMEYMIEKNKQIDVVMSLNDPSATGAIAALKAVNRLNGVLVYGVDGSDDAKRLIKSGELTATVIQSPDKIGRIAVESAYKLLDGEKIPRDFTVEVKLVDKNNIDNYAE